jgi:uncharacterized protein (TIGR00369 family)
MPAATLLDRAELQTILDTAFSDGPSPYRVGEVRHDGVTVHLDASAVQVRPGGTVSGPTLMALADCAAWVATLARIGPVLLSVTSTLTINFLRKPAPGAVTAEAELLKLGRRQSVCDVRLRSDDGGVLVAQSTVTYAIPSAGADPRATS